jgi:putative transcriptional regulator
LGGSLRALPWHRVGRMFEEVRLPLSGSGVKAALMRIKPGQIMPRHSHSGLEYTLVLAGGYQDKGVAFRRGDYSELDSNQEHQPVADQDGECLCLVVLDAPVRLSGLVGRLINPFLRV